MNERMNEQGMMNVEYLNESVTETKWNVLMKLTMLAIPRNPTIPVDAFQS